MIRTYSVCSGSSRMSCNSPAAPMMPFMGVRISWLMTARKSVRARTPASASSRARAISRSIRLRSVTSVKVRTALPPGNTVVRTSSTVPLERVRS